LLDGDEERRARTAQEIPNRSEVHDKIIEHLRSAGATVTSGDAESFTVHGATSQEVGTLAGQAGITLWELSPVSGSLEDAYLALTRDTLDFQEAA